MSVGFQESITIPDDVFILNPARQQIVIGRRNYAYLWSRFGCAGVLMVGIVLFIIGVGLPRVINEVKLATMKTASIEAQVTDHNITYGKSTTYSIDYAFTVQGQTYEGGESIDSVEYDEWPIGSDLQVTYVVDDPSVSHLGGPGLNWLSIIYLPIVLLFLILFAFFWWRQSRPMRQRLKHYREDGQLIFGQLNGSSGELIKRGSGRNRRTDYDVTISYGFVSPSGKKFGEKTTFTRNDLKKKELPQRGSVAILYVNDSDYMVL